MATNKETLFDKTLSGSFWNAGVTFERTNPVPLEKYSIFRTLTEAKTYARDNAVAYPGQIVTVIDGDQILSEWTFTPAGAHTIEFKNGFWYIDSIKCINAKQTSYSLAVTNGTTTATRTITSPYQVSNYKIVDTDGRLEQIDAPVAIATKSQLGVIKVGEGLGITDDGTLSAQKLNVDMVIDDTTKTSANPVATSAVVEYGKTAYDSAGTAASLINALDYTSTAGSQKIVNTVTETDGLISVTYRDLTISEVSGLQTSLDNKYDATKGNKVSVDLDALKTRVGTAETNIQGLQTISTSHDSRIAAIEISIVDTRTTLNTVSSDYLKGVDKTELEGKITAAQQAAELSAQAVRNDLSDYVDYDDVKGGRAALTGTVKLVTTSDIKDLSGAMHFIGVATLSTEAEAPTSCLVRTFPNAKKGDVAIITNTAQEYVYVGDTAGVAADWRLLGDENTYATKAELEAETTARSTADTTLQTNITNEATARQQEDTALGNRITSVENSLTSYALSADVDTISNVLLQTIANESASRAIADSYISAKTDNKVKVGIGTYESTAVNPVESLSVVKISDEDYYRLVAEEKQNNDIIYIVSSDYVNGYDERIINVGTAINDTDAVNLSTMNAAMASLNAISAITLNGDSFTVTAGVATLNVNVISCGGAAD